MGRKEGNTPETEPDLSVIKLVKQIEEASRNLKKINQLNVW